jgi:biotin carboxylase
MRASTYRAPAFYRAAQKLGIQIIPGVDIHPELADYWQLQLALQFDEPDKAAQTIVDFAREHPVQAILPVDDSGVLIAAKASQALGLTHNAAESALAARNKYEMRRLFAASGVPAPYFTLYNTQTDDPQIIAAQAHYPCVLKPLLLSGSRGVIRANTPAEFVETFNWLKQYLGGMNRAPGSTDILVEDFIPGVEVSLEGIMNRGRLKMLALFDKPDPLDGPLFEETIYVTPSRLPESTQAQITTCAEQAAHALGLRHGPIHAELRVNQNGPWLVELNGRSIGGLCSQTLNFGLEGISLEELILRQAVGMEIASLTRESQARGVMMIPIPAEGIFKGVSGLEAAQAIPGIESIEITAKINYPLKPLPAGDSYLGFIFAKADDPATVEAALRKAHQQLRFEILEMLPMVW